MPLTSNRTPVNLASLDWIFGRMAGQWTSNGLPPDIVDQAGLPAGPPTAAAAPYGSPTTAWAPQPPPALTDQASLQAAYEWFEAERIRLEEFTRQQFATVRAHQQADLARHYRNEETLALRAQDLNREMQFLATQSQALQARARQLAQWEGSLSLQAQKLFEAHEQILLIHQTSGNVQEDLEAHQASLERMREEMAQLQTAEAAARSTFAVFDANLADRQRAWEKKQADLTARQMEMEQRYQALEQSEEAATKRLAELDDLENRLREEFEGEQRQLGLERQEIEALYAELRSRSQPLLEKPAPPPVMGPPQRPHSQPQPPHVKEEIASARPWSHLREGGRDGRVAGT